MKITNQNLKSRLKNAAVIAAQRITEISEARGLPPPLVIEKIILKAIEEC